MTEPERPRTGPRRALPEEHEGIVVPDGGDPQFPEYIPGGGSDDDLGRQIASGAKWSMVGNIVTRAGSLLIGIVVANLVGRDGVGLFAIALTVGQMLLTFIDMGLGTDLVRGSEEEMERKAPTIASLGLIFCVIGAVLLLVLADPIAGLMGDHRATALLRIYAIMVFIGGLAIVPQAILTRHFDQRSLFFATVANFVVSNGLTLGLLLSHAAGVIALPIGAAVGMGLEVSLFYVFSRRGLHFGWDRSIMRSALGFGAPVAGSNVLQVLLSSVDRLVIGPVLGTRRLGEYTLGSNVSNWPVSVFGIVVRSVAMPAFARTDPKPRDPVLTLAAQLTWLISLPVGLMLALFAHDVVFFLYTPDFARSVPVLTALGLYGAVRVMFDTLTGYLYARSNSRAVLVANVVWLVALFSATWIGAHFWSVEGAATAQLVVVVCVALPMFLAAAHRTGASIPDIVKALGPATFACIPAALVSVLLSRLVDHLHLTGIVRVDAMLGLLVGGLSFLAVYVPLVYRRVRRSISAMRQAEPDVMEEAVAH